MCRTRTFLSWICYLMLRSRAPRMIPLPQLGRRTSDFCVFNTDTKNKLLCILSSVSNITLTAVSSVRVLLQITRETKLDMQLMTLIYLFIYSFMGGCSCEFSQSDQTFSWWRRRRMNTQSVIMFVYPYSNSHLSALRPKHSPHLLTVSTHLFPISSLAFLAYKPACLLLVSVRLSPWHVARRSSILFTC